jgi:hypothetical protein
MYNTNNNEKDSHYIGIFLKYYPFLKVVQNRHDTQVKMTF